MRFVCQIGNCKRNKKPSVFVSFEELWRHVNNHKWQHGEYKKRKAKP